MGSIRDINCGTDVGKMEKLGRFDREFIVYGCSFLQNEKKHFFLTSQKKKAYSFYQSCLETDVCPTSIQEHLKSLAVPSGAREEIILNTKIELANKMNQTYSKVFFDILKKMADTEATDDSLELLERIKNSMEGEFDRDHLQLFNGLVKMAYQEKTLTMNSFNYFKKWIKKQYHQMEDDIVIKRPFYRVFSGFAYQTHENKTRYFYDGQIETVQEKSIELQKQGRFVTPIYTKKYWFGNEKNVRQVRQEFINELQQNINGRYIKIASVLHDKPEKILFECAFREELEKYALNSSEIDELMLYAYRWKIC